MLPDAARKTVQEINVKLGVYLATLLLLATQFGGCPTIVAEGVEAGAVVTTTGGTFTIVLDPDRAPQTVAAFAERVASGFYDNTLVQRIVPDDRVEAGGYELGLAAKPARDPIINESNNGLSNVRGTIAMARPNDPNAATSEFFFNIQDNTGLDPQNGQLGYTVFGDVVSGLDVVDAIAAVATTARSGLSDVPVENIVITAATRLDDVNGQPRVQIETSKGTIIVELDPNAAPVTVDNFLQYVADDFYSGTLFHRVVAGFIVQGGGYVLAPVAKEAVDVIPNESRNTASNTRGTVAMRYDPETNAVTPTFIVNLADHPEFDATDAALGFPVIGVVYDGLDVIEQIAAAPSESVLDFQQVPVEAVVIQGIELIEIQTGELELTDYGEYYRSNAEAQTFNLFRDLISNLILYSVTGL